ncbi:MAG: hypothetical protein AB7S26_08750 [Sandaracinaceae bacterium]
MRALAPLAVCLFACSPPPIDPEAGCDTGVARVEVGTWRAGRLSSIPSEGGELTIVRGAQGGIHVLVGAWVSDVDLELSLGYRLTDPETSETLGIPTQLELRPELFDRTGPRPERGPDLLVLDNSAQPVAMFAGRAVSLEAETRSRDGSHACDRRTVTLLGD